MAGLIVIECLQIPTERIVPFCAKFQDHMNGSLSKLFRKSVMEALEVRAYSGIN